MAERVSPKDLVAVLRNEERPAGMWASQADQLTRKKAFGAALLAEARAVGAGASSDRLRAWLVEKAPRLDAAQAERCTEEATAAALKMKRFGDADDEKVVARLVQGIVDGGDAVKLLTAVAETLHETGDDRAALDVVRGATAVAPEGPAAAGAAGASASIFVGLGRFDEARAAIELLAPHDAKKAASLRTYVGALTHPFDFRAAAYLAGDPDEDAELSPLSVADAQSGIRSIAARAARIRAALAPLAGDAPWLPDVAPLLAGDAKLLRDDYDVESVPDTLPDLMFELRREWSRLSWAIAALGGTSLTMPTAVVKPRCSMGFVDTFTAARYDLLCDVAEGNVPAPDDELEKELLASTWGDTRLADLEPYLAQIWLDETEAALAGLRWAMGKVKTPWEVE